MTYTKGDRLAVSIDGETLTVTFQRRTADGLLLVSDGEKQFTAGGGEVKGRPRELTFGVYPGTSDHEDNPFAVMNQERPDIPRGMLMAIQEHVNEAVDAGELPDDQKIPEAGRATYLPGKADGEVLAIELTN